MRWSKKEAYELYCSYTAHLPKKVKRCSKCEVAAKQSKEQFDILDDIIELKALALRFT